MSAACKGSDTAIAASTRDKLAVCRAALAVWLLALPRSAASNEINEKKVDDFMVPLNCVCDLLDEAYQELDAATGDPPDSLQSAWKFVRMAESSLWNVLIDASSEMPSTSDLRATIGQTLVYLDECTKGLTSIMEEQP